MKYLRFMLTFTLPVLVMVGASGAANSADDQKRWNVVCQDDNKPASCRMEQNLYVSKELDSGQKQSGKILGVTILYVTNQKTGEREPHMNLMLPLGVDLRAGVVFRVDKQAETQLRFLTCTDRGCETALPVSDKMLENMLDGREMQVGFRGWGSQQTSVVKVSLIGFTRAFSALG